MKKYVSLALGIVMAVALVVTVFGCGGAPTSNEGATPDTSEPAPPTAAPPAAEETESSAGEDSDSAALEPESAPPSEGMGEMSLEPAAAAAVAAGAPLTAESIVGSKWGAGGMTFTFEKDGVLKVNDQIPGTWSMDGTSLKVGAMGQEYAAIIEGDKITYDGTPLERMN